MERQQQLEEYEKQLADVDELLKASPKDPSLISLRSDLLELIDITQQEGQQQQQEQQQQHEDQHNDGGEARQSAVESLHDETDGNEVAGSVIASAGEAAGEAVTGDATDDSERDDEGHGLSTWSVVETGPKQQAEGKVNQQTHQQTHHQQMIHDAAATGKHRIDREDDGVDQQQQQPPPKKKAKCSSVAVAAVTVKEFEVPPHLVPLETDTDKERNRKRRAIKALKNKWREQKKNVEAEKKQKSWQSFQTKAMSKKKTKSRTVIKEKSMFSTHDGADAKVGVVSVSGRQLTDFGGRKRHK